MMGYSHDRGKLASVSNDYRVRIGGRYEERFAFLPPGTRIPPVEGEVLFVSGRPYPDYDGRLMRTIVSQDGKGFDSYRVRTESEKRFQEMCKRAGIAIPLPASQPSPRWRLKAAVAIVSLGLLLAFCYFVSRKLVAIRDKAF
jgi:hypothetical protein